MQLEVLNIAIETIQQLRPVVTRIRRHDRALAKQITDAANSVVLNLGEGALSEAGTRKSRYQSAAGSANEVRVGIVAAVAWGHVSQQQAEPIAQRYDRVVAMLYKLVRA
jgi:four helix bundle protein